MDLFHERPISLVLRLRTSWILFRTSFEILFCNCYGLRGRSDSYLCLYTLNTIQTKTIKTIKSDSLQCNTYLLWNDKKAGNTTWHLLFLGCSSQRIIYQKTLKIEIHLTPWIWENRGCWAQPRCLRQYEVEKSAFHMFLNLLTLPKFFKSVVIPTILHHLFLYRLLKLQKSQANWDVGETGVIIIILPTQTMPLFFFGEIPQIYHTF